MMSITATRKVLMLIAISAFLLGNPCFAQKSIKNGSYTLDFIDLEYQGKKLGTCKAVVKSGKVKLIVINGCHRKKGAIIEQGLLLKHKTGVWIIAKHKSDVNAKEVGGCSDGPYVINFKRKRLETC
jgi:hypothetical protein